MKIAFTKRIIRGVAIGAVALSLVVSGLALAADASGSYTFASDDALRLDGSTTVYPIVAQALNISAPGATSTSGPFQNAGHNGLKAQVYQGGSGVGRFDINAQNVDIGDASTFDAGHQSTYPNVVPNKIARDGVCIIINNQGNSITNITRDEVEEIYNAYYPVGGFDGSGNPLNVQLNDGTNGTPGITKDGKNQTVASTTQNATQVGGVWMLPPIHNWSQVGGPNHEIVVYSRITASGTRDAMGDFYVLDKTNCEPATVAHSGTSRTDSNADFVSYIQGAPYSIGYVGIGYATPANLGSSVTCLNVNGIRATKQNVTAADLAGNSARAYPFSRYLYLLQLQQSSVTDSTVSAHYANATAFITWMQSAPGQTIVQQQNFVKLVPDADINTDGSIGGLDLAQMALQWGKSGSGITNPKCDISLNTDGTIGDGSIGGLDLAQLGLWWGLTYGSAGNLTPTYP